MENSVVIPGELLTSAAEFNTGDNVHVKNGKIYASRAGRIKYQSHDKVEKKIISVEPPPPEYGKNMIKYAFISIGSIVVCRVKSIQRNQCKVDIICVKGISLKFPYRGVIYSEDISSCFDKDFIKVFNAYRVGDIILGRVIGVLDTHGSKEKTLFHISTAENELGVVLAKNYQTNKYMIPFSWREMICPSSGNKEIRKVAKVLIIKD